MFRRMASPVSLKTNNSRNARLARRRSQSSHVCADFARTLSSGAISDDVDASTTTVYTITRAEKDESSVVVLSELKV